MAVLKWLIAGTVGASIGGAIWVLLGYFADLEVGYVAWGIGLLAGLGVRFKTESHEVNAAAGIAAVAAAMLVIAGSKYAVVWLHVNNMLEPILAAEAAVDPVELVAGDIVVERGETGQPVEWPEPVEVAVGDEGADVEVAFPEDVLEEARQRWEAMPERERTEYQAAKRLEREEEMAAIREVINNEVFKASFGAYDLLWFGLALFTAFKVGRGAGESAGEATAAAEPEEQASSEEPATGAS